MIETVLIPQRLQGAIALVTGGAAGLGLATARRLREEGARVVISDVLSEQGRCVADEHDLTFFEQDVCNEARWDTLVKAIEAKFGKLDVLVNNAGILGPKDQFSPEDTRYADWQRVFAVNVDGVFLGCRAAIPAMRRAGGGAIINISSIAGLLATPYGTAYGASKAAVRQLTKSVAQYCAQQKLNVRCNSVHPGDVLTNMVERSIASSAEARGLDFERAKQERQAGIPLGEFVTPDAVAAMVAFLASYETRHITGAEMVVDGGITNCDTFAYFLKS